jgi:hypothetical protein
MVGTEPGEEAVHDPEWNGDGEADEN